MIIAGLMQTKEEALEISTIVKYVAISNRMRELGQVSRIINGKK